MWLFLSLSFCLPSGAFPLWALCTPCSLSFVTFAACSWLCFVAGYMLGYMVRLSMFVWLCGIGWVLGGYVSSRVSYVWTFSTIITYFYNISVAFSCLV